MAPGISAVWITYHLQNSFRALESLVNVAEDRYGHALDEICQIRMTSLEIVQLPVQQHR